jgi:SagB-type dehydrogenase family enzyme
MEQPTDAAAEFYEQTKILLKDWIPAEELPPPVTPGTVLARFPLPWPPVSGWPSLEQSIVSRRTSRSFDPLTPLPLETLARFVAFSCGLTAAMSPDGLVIAGYHRAAPSAGARYPIDVGLVALRVTHIAAGSYLYDSQQHALCFVRSGWFAESIARWALNQPWMAGAGAVFALIGDAARIQERYGARGYRYMLFEAGHIAQNLYLLGAAHGLCVQATGGFFEDAFDRLFALDDTERHVLYLVAVGVPSPERGLAPW